VNGWLTLPDVDKYLRISEDPHRYLEMAVKTFKCLGTFFFRYWLIPMCRAVSQGRAEREDQSKQVTHITYRNKERKGLKREERKRRTDVEERGA